jgi:hypothetical protein
MFFTMFIISLILYFLQYLRVRIINYCTAEPPQQLPPCFFRRCGVVSSLTDVSPNEKSRMMLVSWTIVPCPLDESVGRSIPSIPLLRVGWDGGVGGS